MKLPALSHRAEQARALVADAKKARHRPQKQSISESRQPLLDGLGAGYAIDKIQKWLAAIITLVWRNGASSGALI
jgi:hypothetical protein